MLATEESQTAFKQITGKRRAGIHGEQGELVGRGGSRRLHRETRDVCVEQRSLGRSLGCLLPRGGAGGRLGFTGEVGLGL